MGQLREDDSTSGRRSRLRTVFLLCGPVIVFPLLGWDAHRRGDQVPMGGVFWPMFWVGAIVCTIGSWVALWRVRSGRK